MRSGAISIASARHEEVPGQMKRWARAGGKVFKGREPRREAEAALYQMRRIDSGLSHGPVHDLGLRSAAASPLVWGAAPATACGWGGTPPWRVAQACVNSAPKNTIRAE